MSDQERLRWARIALTVIGPLALFCDPPIAGIGIFAATNAVRVFLL